ncbi:M1 family metallopeptidase [Micromonospora krabiensis]|uniref:Aminopeptidase N n=1 Tax=Micromonospora krabiensis TaxID=307121 RepID=A0A1C3N326_9ACTN|nr:M1 family metallopeptidase [Micromonospora krabiensis]SBV26971.1 Peptidase family M1 [Micromonospora krabiensis]
MRHRYGVAVLALAALLAGCTADPPAPPADPTGPSASPAGLPGPYAAWAAGRSTPVVDPLYPQHGTDAVDVLHYGLDLSWSPTKRTLTGTATLHIRPVRDAAAVTLDFKPYALDGVTVDGAAAQGTVTAEKLVVDTPVKAAVPVTLVVRYHGKPSTTGFPTKRGDAHPLGLTVDAEGGIWTMQEPFGAFTWYPANDHPSDEALYDIAVTVPKGWSGIASGTPVGQQGNTFRYRSTVPVASYLTTLAVGRYKKATATGPRGIPITYWYRSGDAKHLPVLKKTPQMLDWMERKFGPYPFDSAGAVLVDSPSAMETQQLTTLGSGMAERGERSFHLNTLHEYAHQWFGDAVTLTDWRDMWLNEGWALYVQKLYEQDRFGLTDAELVRASRELDGVYRKQYGPPGDPKPAEFGATNVYTCGAAMLRQLHQALGDGRFFDLARGWVQENLHTQQTRASFTAYVNEKTGHDFTPLIDAWLDSPTTPPETGPLPAGQ